MLLEFILRTIQHLPAFRARQEMLNALVLQHNVLLLLDDIARAENGDRPVT